MIEKIYLISPESKLHISSEPIICTELFGLVKEQDLIDSGWIIIEEKIKYWWINTKALDETCAKHLYKFSAMIRDKIIQVSNGNKLFKIYSKASGLNYLVTLNDLINHKLIEILEEEDKYLDIISIENYSPYLTIIDLNNIRSRNE